MPAKPLHQKLRLSEGDSVLVINGPPNYEELLGSVPEGIVISEDPGEEVDFVHLFARNRADLDEYIDVALGSVKYDGLLWVSYPKGSSGVETDINRDIIWELLKAKGIRPVTQVSVDSTWSALRFRPEEMVGR
ncbi:MAG: DUF3052 family protein [Anaerolineae bacterium]|jgi:hypothetical protein